MLFDCDLKGKGSHSTIWKYSVQAEEAERHGVGTAQDTSPGLSLPLSFKTVLEGNTEANNKGPGSSWPLPQALCTCRSLSLGDPDN